MLSDPTAEARLFLLYLLSPLAPRPLAAEPVLRVVLMRHGEKPNTGDNLSCAGLNRALALPAVLNSLLPQPPDFTYVPLIGTNGKDTTSIRMLQTVTPYAVQHNLTINSDYETTNTKGVAKSVRCRRGTVLLVWEHKAIPKIAKKLGLKDDLSWPDTDFDSIWIIDFHGGGTTGKAKEPRLTKSQAHIQPSAACPSQ